jgi:hypothetical protein
MGGSGDHVLGRGSAFSSSLPFQCILSRLRLPTAHPVSHCSATSACVTRVRPIGTTRALGISLASVRATDLTSAGQLVTSTSWMDPPSSACACLASLLRSPSERAARWTRRRGGCPRSCPEQLPPPLCPWPVLHRPCGRLRAVLRLLTLGMIRHDMRVHITARGNTCAYGHGRCGW